MGLESTEGSESNLNTIFGAIIALTGPADFPDSRNLSTPDVLSVTSISLPSSSGDTFGDLNISLSPGSALSEKQG